MLDDFECGKASGSRVALYPNDNGTGTCGGVNQHWSYNSNGTITNELTGMCLDVNDFTGAFCFVVRSIGR